MTYSSMTLPSVVWSPLLAIPMSSSLVAAHAPGFGESGASSKTKIVGPSLTSVATPRLPRYRARRDEEDWENIVIATVRATVLDLRPAQR